MVNLEFLTVTVLRPTDNPFSRQKNWARKPSARRECGPHNFALVYYMYDVFLRHVRIHVLELCGHEAHLHDRKMGYAGALEKMVRTS